MRYRVQQFLTLTALTALEALRQPIALILLTTCVLFMAVLPLLITHSLGEAARLVRDSALALHMVTGLLMGSLAASASLTVEIRRGTAAAVLAKPVGREIFFLAKFSGVALLVALFSFAAILATMLSARTAAQAYSVDWFSAAVVPASVLLALVLAGFLNYVLRKPFVSNAFGLCLLLLSIGFCICNVLDPQGHPASFGAFTPWELLPAGLLITMAVLVLTGIAVTLATRLGTVATLSLCSVVFVLGLMSDYLFGRLAESSMAARLLYSATPNWQHFWTADALSRDIHISPAYLGSVGTYALFYLVGVLGLGIVSFRHKDIPA